MRAKHIPVLIAESSNVTQSSDSRPSFSRGWGLLGLTLGHGVSNKSRLRLAEMNAKPATHARIDRPERKKSSVWTSWIASVSSQSPAQRSGSRTIVSLIQASVGGTHGLWRNKIQSSEIIHGRSPLGCPCGTAALGSLWVGFMCNPIVSRERSMKGSGRVGWSPNGQRFGSAKAINAWQTGTRLSACRPVLASRRPTGSWRG